MRVVLTTSICSVYFALFARGKITLTSILLSHVLFYHLCHCAIYMLNFAIASPQNCLHYTVSTILFVPSISPFCHLHCAVSIMPAPLWHIHPVSSPHCIIFTTFAPPCCLNFIISTRPSLFFHFFHLISATAKPSPFDYVISITSPPPYHLHCVISTTLSPVSNCLSQHHLPQV